MRDLSPLLKEAANEATAVADYPAAAEWYSQLLAITRGSNDIAEFLAIIKDYANACLRADVDRAAVLFQEGLDCDPRDSALWLGFARAKRLQGDLATALSAVNESLTIKPSLDAQYLRATLHGIRGDIGEARLALQQLLPLAPENSDGESICTRSAILLNLGMAAYAQGSLSKATELSLQSVDCSMPGERAQALQNASWFLAITGKWPSARSLAAEGVQAARAEGDPVGLSYLLAIVAKLDAWAGETALALDNALQAIRIARTAGLRSNEIDGLLALGIVQLEVGSTSEALAALAPARNLATSTLEVNEPFLLLSAFQEAVAFEGIAERSDQEIAKATTQCDEVWSTAVDRSKVLLKIANKDFAGAMEAAASWNGNDILPYEAAKFLLVSARLARHQRERTLAQQLERNAATILTFLGRSTLPAIALLTEGLLGAGRGRPRHRNPGGLTTREIEVGRLAVNGLTDREIAQQLFISTRTVSKHMENVLAKTGCSRRAQLSHFFQVYYSDKLELDT